MKPWMIVLVALMALGGALEAFDVLDVGAALEWARAHGHGWQLPAAIVLVQTVLYTFAQPGSVLFWVAAVLYPAPHATLILATGGTAGALGAYLFARRLAQADATSASEGRLFRLIARHGDFFTLSALRVMPGMPHSALNYAAGSARLSLPIFLASTAIGMTLKSYLYSSAIQGALETASPADLLRPEVLAPLLAITAMLLAARLFFRRRRPVD